MAGSLRIEFPNALYHITSQTVVEQDADLSEIPSAQKRKLAKPIQKHIDTAGLRIEGIYLAYRSEAYTMKSISDELGLHYSTVSKIIKTLESSRSRLDPVAIPRILKIYQKSV